MPHAASEPASVRRAVAVDAGPLVDLHHACWLEAYADLLPPARIEEVFADRAGLVARRQAQLTDARLGMWVAHRVGELVGFATVGPARRDDAPTPLELYAIYSRAAEWGRGTGPALLAAAVGDRPAYLWALAGNGRALAFYARHGFAPDGVTEHQPLGEHVRLVRPERAVDS